MNGLHIEKDEKGWGRGGGQSIHHCIYLPVEFNFILKDVLECLKQVCDMLGQKDLFGNNLIGAGGDFWFREHIEVIAMVQARKR